MPKKIIALTGPSMFTPQCIKMIEECIDANFVLLYQNSMGNVQRWLDACDGVVLAGGVDIHPTVYGQNVQSQQGLSKFDMSRDVKELMIVDYCFQQKIPILGICRGHQLLSVYKGLGNDFIMDLDGSTVHQPAKYNITVSLTEPCHAIELLDLTDFAVGKPAERAALQKTLGDGESPQIAWVNSWHHQGVEYVKKNKEFYAKNSIKVLAVASTGMKDIGPVIEVMKGTGDESHWVSAQFHPENDYADNTASRLVVEMFKTILSRGRQKQNYNQ